MAKLVAVLNDESGDTAAIAKVRLEAIPGTVPKLIEPAAGCRFAGRCKYVTALCHAATPPLVEVKSDTEMAMEAIQRSGSSMRSFSSLRSVSSLDRLVQAAEEIPRTESALEQLARTASGKIAFVSPHISAFYFGIS